MAYLVKGPNCIHRSYIIPVWISHRQDVEVVEVEDVRVEVGVDDQLVDDEGGGGRRDPLTSVNTWVKARIS